MVKTQQAIRQFHQDSDLDDVAVAHHIPVDVIVRQAHDCDEEGGQLNIARMVGKRNATPPVDPFVEQEEGQPQPRIVDRREEKELPVQGVFVEIGILPNSEIVKGLVETNKFGEIVVNHKTQETSCAGIWAAGDATDVLYKQNNISAGDAVKAVLHIYDKIVKG